MAIIDRPSIYYVQMQSAFFFLIFGFLFWKRWRHLLLPPPIPTWWRNLWMTPYGKVWLAAYGVKQKVIMPTSLYSKAASNSIITLFQVSYRKKIKLPLQNGLKKIIQFWTMPLISVNDGSKMEVPRITTFSTLYLIFGFLNVYLDWYFSKL